MAFSLPLSFAHSRDKISIGWINETLGSLMSVNLSPQNQVYKKYYFVLYITQFHFNSEPPPFCHIQLK